MLPTAYGDARNIDLYGRVNVGTKIIVLPNPNTVATTVEPTRVASHNNNAGPTNIY